MTSDETDTTSKTSPFDILLIITLFGNTFLACKMKGEWT